jgi:hypothetical protein
MTLAFCRALAAQGRAQTGAAGEQENQCRQCSAQIEPERGPWVRGRHIDLSPAAARAIGL